ncbi:MAG: HNH endonuclease [Balneola sp.]
MPELLSKIQNWEIERAYELSAEDESILQQFPVNKAKDWKKPEFKPIRDRIREFYRNIQNDTCCYCRLPINKGSDQIEIEHIIDKNKRLDFIFEGRNLVVSCHKCNFTKSKKPVMALCPPINQYPQDGSTFNILQGHYDDYFEHIEFLEDSIYHALTTKGEFTIQICGLDRVGLAEQREKVTLYEDDELVSDVIDIRNSANNDEKIDALIEKLKALKG